MSLTLIDNPVKTVLGVVQNIFAGFLPVNFEFKREDLQIQSLGLGVGTGIRITITKDLTSVLNIGDTIYLGAVGILGFIYDDSGVITDITSTTIDVDIDFIETSSTGYINYLKNYYVEAQLVNPDNSAIKLLPFSLKNDGDLAGNITIDVSIGNDKNDQFFEFVSQVMDKTRLELKMQYRQVFDDSSESFTLIDTEIILVFATEQPETEAFLNKLDNAEFYKGYPFGVVLSHSKENSDDVGLNIFYDELDINQSNLTVDNAIITFDSDLQGFIFINIDKDIVYNNDAEFIKIKGVYAALPQYNPTQYNNAQYKVT